MPSPFPGMNPYLEHPALWAGIHHRLITAIANDLAPKIRPLNFIGLICKKLFLAFRYLYDREIANLW
jgi:hypothetical protein